MIDSNAVSGGTFKGRNELLLTIACRASHENSIEDFVHETLEGLSSVT